MMFLYETPNEHGTIMSVHSCDTCMDSFTVIPSAAGRDGWGSCLSEVCGSYDVTRDADLLFERGLVQRETGE